MAYTLGNKCAKIFVNGQVLLQFIIENVVTCYTQCSYPLHAVAYLKGGGRGPPPPNRPSPKKFLLCLSSLI